MKRFVLVLGLFVFAFSLSLNSAFCQKEEPALVTAPALLEPSASLKFTDIPVPNSFIQLPKETYTFESAGVRVGVLRYQGKANPDQVVSFYKEQMPMYNWNLLNVIEYGERLLNFDREQETCTISMLQKGKNVILTISVGPKPQLLKKSKGPVK